VSSGFRKCFPEQEFNIIFLAGRVSLRYAILDEGPDEFDVVDHAMVRRLTQEDDTFRLERFI